MHSTITCNPPQRPSFFQHPPDFHPLKIELTVNMPWRMSHYVSWIREHARHPQQLAVDLRKVENFARQPEKSP
ncbi:hypothetical protein ACHQM5_023483 [Ranunculus cassubicifolius]